MSAPASPPRCSGLVRGKFAHTADCGSTTGTASSSASSTSAPNPSGARPTDSVISTGRSAASSRRAARSSSSSVLTRRPAGATGRTSARAASQGASSTSTGTFRYTGPAGPRTASSAARTTDPYSVPTSPTCDDHFTHGAANACGPPTIDRLRYHCDPGSTAPAPADRPSP